MIGIIGNFLVLYIYFRKKDKLILSIFILVLVGVDFFMCFVIVFFNIIILYLDYKYGYDLMCWLYMFLIIGGVLFVIFIMVVIVFDRYFCICYFFFYVIIIFWVKLIIFILFSFVGIFGIMVVLMYGINDIILDFSF